MLRRLLDSSWLYFALAGVLFIVMLSTMFEVRLPPRPAGTPDDIRGLAQRDDLNLVFILVDTLRADRLSAYGYERETSPVMDYLASEGIRFETVVSQSSWTKSSMASMWTGTWPRTNGVTRFNHGLPPEVLMPPEIMSEAGIYTAGLWRNGWVAPNFGFSQGFDTYLKPMPGRTPERFERKTPSSASIMGTDEDLTIGAQEFLKAYGKERFFLYIHYMDVHQYAYDDVSGLFGTSYSDVYDNSIHWVDRNIGVVVRDLQDQGLMDRTIIVIASDHGEGFREHGLEGHAKTLYREVTGVPWIVALPFRLDPGIVVESVVANADIWPTLLDLMGLPSLEYTDGASLVPQIEAAARGQAEDFERTNFAQIDRVWGQPSKTPDPLVAVTRGPYRLLRPIDEAKWAESEAFDHSADPWEDENLLAGGKGEIPPEIQADFDAYLEVTEPPWGVTSEVELNEMELNQLRALGYVVK